MRFPIVQLEFTHALGPPAGRYTVREDAPSGNGATPASPGSADVLVIQVEGAPPTRRRLLRARVLAAKSGAAAAEVPIVLATLVKGTSALGGCAEGDALLADMHDGGDRVERWVAEGLAVVNRAITAYRLCAGDPHVVGVTRQDARAVRIGYGTGEQVFHGGWERAIEVPPPRAPKVKREVTLMPQQGVAAVLSAGAPLLEAEELVLRAALDLEQGRERAAAVGLNAGFDLLRAELRHQDLSPGARRRLQDAESGGGELAELASRATGGTLEPGDRARLDLAVKRVGGVVDAWRYQPPEV
jgi:hypothetical protein